MAQNVVIIFEDSGVEEIIRFVKSKETSDQDVLVVATEYQAAKKIEKLEVSCKSVLHYINKDTFQGLDVAAKHFGEHWYELLGLKDAFRYRSIDAAAMLSWDLSYYFATAFRYIELARNILKVENPSVLWIRKQDRREKSWSDFHFHLIVQIVSEIARLSNVNVREIPEITSREWNRRKTRKRYSIQRLTKAFLKLIFRLLKSVINLANGLRSNTSTIRILSLVAWKHVAEVINMMDYPAEIVWLNSLGPFSATSLWGKLVGLREAIRRGMHFIFRPEIDRSSINQEARDADTVINWEAHYETSCSCDGEFKYKGIAFWESLRQGLFDLLRAQLPRVIREVDVAYEIIQSKAINLMLVENDVVEWQKVFVNVGKELGVPAIVIQHGCLGDSIGFVPLSADVFAAWGELDRGRMMNWGVPPDRIQVTGCPRFDHYNDHEHTTTRGALRNNHKKLVMFASGHGDIPYAFSNRHISSYEEEEALAQLVRAAHSLDFKLVVKLHPGEGQPSLLKASAMDMADKLGIDVTVTKSADLQHLLVNCDVLVMFSSTVGLEAMMLGRPVISLWGNGKSATVSHVSQGPAITVKAQAELENVLSKIFENTEFRKRIEDNTRRFLKECYLFDGKSGERIARLIKKVHQETENKNKIKQGQKGTGLWNRSSDALEDMPHEQTPFV